MGKVPAALKGHQFTKGSGKAKAAGKKKPGSGKKSKAGLPAFLARKSGSSTTSTKKKGKIPPQFLKSKKTRKK